MPQGAPNASLSGRDVAVAVAMNLMWGLNIVAIKMGVDLIAPLTAAFLRQTMVLAFCLPMLRIVPGRMRDLVALGILSGAVFYLVTNLSMAASDNVGVLAIAGQLGVPISVVLAVVFLDERIGWRRVAGIGLSFAGVLLLLFDPAAASERLGLVLTAIAALFWGICSLIQRRLAGVPVLTIYAWVGLFGSVLLLPCMLVFEADSMRRLPDAPLEAFGWVLFSALGSTIVGQGAMSWLLARHPVTVISPLTLATPVVSVIAASFWFATPLTARTFFAGLMVLGGIAIVTIRTARFGAARGSA